MLSDNKNSSNNQYYYKNYDQEIYNSNSSSNTKNGVKADLTKSYNDAISGYNSNSKNQNEVQKSTSTPQTNKFLMT